MNTKNPWKINSTKEAYDNQWLTILEHQVTNPKGNPGIYGVVHFKQLAICVLPLDDEYNTWIVGQYRFPLNQYSWEIPEGGGPLAIDPLESAKRELKEECGIEATSWIKIAECNTSNSCTDEKAMIFIAKNLSFHHSNPEETEVLQVKKIPFAELFRMVMQGEIMDAPTIIAALKAKLLMDEGMI
ncbi:MAG TPA: NUDIX hydrolase [Chitinophagales bacterium]|nr:NUDIX hydrolase [Chitinophagales bacterium]